MVSTWGLNLFDRLHIGHQVMIDRLSEMPNPIACVTGGELVGKGLELEKLIQPIEIREKNLKDYLQRTELENSVSVKTVTKFDDLLSIKEDVTFMMYEGPCCTEIEAGALDIRKKKMGMNDTMEYLKPVRAHDGGKLASARIRLGEIDREGRRLRGTSEPPRELPLKGRSGLKAPKGEVFAAVDGEPEKRVVSKLKDDSPECVIAVGDVTVGTILAERYTPHVMIVDGITKRGPFEERFTGDIIYTIYNPPAVIYPEAWSVIDTAIHDEANSLVLVEGEEDLMGFPAVLLASDKSVVLYGQPNVGIVWIPVNPENKQVARALLEQMPVIQ
ncbi:MAG: DUF359 domain-containing protein [Candidatus Thorarchaeota archaeon SMTZ1-45]|nr:MAG: hypothetical protein AM325_12105 [Candidatus Thorarchaeota archaeon SMTZ1-45]